MQNEQEVRLSLNSYLKSRRNWTPVWGALSNMLRAVQAASRAISEEIVAAAPTEALEISSSQLRWITECLPSTVSRLCSLAPTGDWQGASEQRIDLRPLLRETEARLNKCANHIAYSLKDDARDAAVTELLEIFVLVSWVVTTTLLIGSAYQDEMHQIRDRRHELEKIVYGAGADNVHAVA